MAVRDNRIVLYIRVQTILQSAVPLCVYAERVICYKYTCKRTSSEILGSPDSHDCVTIYVCPGEKKSPYFWRRTVISSRVILLCTSLHRGVESPADHMIDNETAHRSWWTIHIQENNNKYVTHIGIVFFRNSHAPGTYYSYTPINIHKNKKCANASAVFGNERVRNHNKNDSITTKLTKKIHTCNNNIRRTEWL